jgi:Flp pilus assembly CpaE family ATPase
VFLTTNNLSPEHLAVVHNLRQATDAKIVVVAPVADHSTILRAIRAGASDFLNSDGVLEEEMADWIARFKSERIQPATKGRLVTVVPCHAPSDASILAVNLAAVIARRAGSCGLLDFQLRGGDLAMLLKLSPRHTVYDLITQRESVDGAMFQQALTEHESGIRLLAGPPLFSNLASIQPHVCSHILGLAQSSMPFVVVNSEDVQHAEQVRSLAGSDHVVLTMRMDLVSLYRAQQHLAYLRRNHVPPEHVQLVAMSTGNSGELPIASVKKVLNAADVRCLPDDLVATTMSINVGNPLVLEAPKSKLAQAIENFATSLLGLTDKPDQSSVRSAPSGLRAAAVLTLNVLPFCK